VSFRQERGYTASPGTPLDNVDHFQLIIYSDGQQEQHGIEQMQYHTTWGLDGNHFFE